jgi:regulator of RNase E activity RraA
VKQGSNRKSWASSENIRRSDRISEYQKKASNIRISEKDIDFFRVTPTPFISDAMMLEGLVNVGMWGILPLVPFTPGKHLAGRAVTLSVMPSRNALKHGGNVFDTVSPSSWNAHNIADSVSGSILVIESRGTWGLGRKSMAGFIKAGFMGCVSDGPTREIDRVKSESFPIMVPGGGGLYGVKMEGGNLLDWVGQNIPVWIQAPGRPGALVKPRDLIVGDNNGVLVVPLTHVRSVIEKTKEIIDA